MFYPRLFAFSSVLLLIRLCVCVYDGNIAVLVCCCCCCCVRVPYAWLLLYFMFHFSSIRSKHPTSWARRALSNNNPRIRSLSRNKSICRIKTFEISCNVWVSCAFFFYLVHQWNIFDFKHLQRIKFYRKHSVGENQ